MHLPRSVFSQRQLDILLWLLTINGVADVPSLGSMKRTKAFLQAMSGVKSIPYSGALGNKYYANSLTDIIALVRDQVS
jgi:hypothetical protein